MYIISSSCIFQPIRTTTVFGVSSFIAIQLIFQPYSGVNPEVLSRVLSFIAQQCRPVLLAQFLCRCCCFIRCVIFFSCIPPGSSGHVLGVGLGQLGPFIYCLRQQRPWGDRRQVPSVFRPRLTSFHVFSCSLACCLCFSFHCDCLKAKVFRTTIVHELLITYGFPYSRNLFFSLFQAQLWLGWRVLLNIRNITNNILYPIALLLEFCFLVLKQFELYDFVDIEIYFRFLFIFYSSCLMSFPVDFQTFFLCKLNVIVF